MSVSEIDFTIARLGECRIPSPKARARTSWRRHVPISLAVSQRKKIDPEGGLWNSVLSSTGQARDMR